MQYWWVNQKQTHLQEIEGGYMWSPKVQANGVKHFSYSYMAHVKPGDVIFSYAKANIIAIGIAQTHCYTFPKPSEFGSLGSNWSNIGWKVDVSYIRLNNPLRTIDHIKDIRHLLPKQYSPIQPKNGNANQAYLFQIEKPLAMALAHLIGYEAVRIVSSNEVMERDISVRTIDQNINEWEEKIVSSLVSSTEIDETEKEVIIKARKGQGKFRELLLLKEPRCRVTKVEKPEHLIASHIKPWRNSNNNERLDAENGFMLTPTIDHLFDKGFISFENNGTIVLADVADREVMEKFGVIGSRAPENIGFLSEGQKIYLDWHRGNILLG